MIVADHKFPFGVTDDGGIVTLSDAVALWLYVDGEVDIGGLTSVEDVAGVFGDLGGINKVVGDTSVGRDDACVVGDDFGGVVSVNVGKGNLRRGALDVSIGVKGGGFVVARASFAILDCVVTKFAALGGVA